MNCVWRRKNFFSRNKARELSILALMPATSRVDWHTGPLHLSQLVAPAIYSEAVWHLTLSYPLRMRNTHTQEQ